jgi:hypothetical protein
MDWLVTSDEKTNSSFLTKRGFRDAQYASLLMRRYNIYLLDSR